MGSISRAAARLPRPWRQYPSSPDGWRVKNACEMFSLSISKSLLTNNVMSLGLQQYNHILSSKVSVLQNDSQGNDTNKTTTNPKLPFPRIILCLGCWQHWNRKVTMVIISLLLVTMTVAWATKWKLKCQHRPLLLEEISLTTIGYGACT